MRSLLIAFSVFFLSLSLFAQSNQKYILPAGTSVVVKIISPITIEKKGSDHIKVDAIVFGDVYDQSGEKILIANGTVVEVQTLITRPSFYGSAAKLVINPISCLAVDGRAVMFDDYYHFEASGDEDAVFSKYKSLSVPSGTCFNARTAQQLVFTVSTAATTE